MKAFKCPDAPQCVGAVDITHTFAVQGVGRTSQGFCNTCHKRYTLVQFVLGPINGSGTGGHAMAQRLKEAARSGALEDARELILGATPVEGADGVPRGRSSEIGEGRP